MLNYEPKWGPKCFVTAWSIHVPIVVLNKSQVTVYLFSLIFYRYIQCLGIMSMQEILSQHFEHYDRIWKAYKTTAKHVDVICGGNMCRFVSCYKYDGSCCGFLNLGKKTNVLFIWWNYLAHYKLTAFPHATTLKKSYAKIHIKDTLLG